MNITLSRNAAKSYDKLDAKTQKRMLAALEALPNGDVAPMSGKFTGYYRLRVGAWRTVLQIDRINNRVYVVEIAPRGDVYK